MEILKSMHGHGVKVIKEVCCLTQLNLKALERRYWNSMLLFFI
jgi:hypothetical protein